METPSNQEHKEKGPTIISVTPEDAATILDIRYRIWLDTYPNEELGITEEDIQTLTTDLESKIEKTKKRIEEGKSIDFLAKYDGESVGWLSLEKNEANNNISALYVLPEFQGKRIGLALMKTALSNLDEARPIHLSVASYNDKAISFYERHGFKVIGDYNREKPYTVNGKVIPEILMEREPK